MCWGYVVRETFDGSLELSRQVLEAMGQSPQMAAERIAQFREHDEALLRTQHLVYDDEAALMQSAREALIDLERIFEADSEVKS